MSGNQIFFHKLSLALGIGLEIKRKTDVNSDFTAKQKETLMSKWNGRDFLMGKDRWISIFEEELVNVRSSGNDKDWQIAGLAYQIARQKGATNDDMEAKLVSVFKDEFRKFSDKSSLLAYFYELSHKLDLTDETKATLRNMFN